MRRFLALFVLSACTEPMSHTELQPPPVPTATLQTATFALG